MACVSVVMTVKMKREEIAQIILSPFTSGGDVVDFYSVSILKSKFTPSTFSLLFLEEPCELSIQHRVVFQPFTPIEKISIIRACSSFHFDMPLNLRIAMLAEAWPRLVSEDPVSSLILLPVAGFDPLGVLVGMSAF